MTTLKRTKKKLTNVHNESKSFVVTLATSESLRLLNLCEQLYSCYIMGHRIRLILCKKASNILIMFYCEFDDFQLHHFAQNYHLLLGKKE